MHNAMILNPSREGNSADMICSCFCSPLGYHVILLLPRHYFRDNRR